VESEHKKGSTFEFFVKDEKERKSEVVKLDFDKLGKGTKKKLRRTL
jgi:hypothetical protein